MSRPRASRRRRTPAWTSWSDEKLLGLRLSDLARDLTIEGTLLGERIKQLYDELAARDLLLRPHCWLSDEWYTPGGVPGIAIPFYLAHPRLARLEDSQLFEVEGGNAEWCMQILRHEAGHAIDNAFRLRRHRRRRELFGKSSEPYPEYYAPRPYSRSFVLHLEPSYAQSHPDEDFAETFAVWLNPESEWRTRYAGWPALKKLEYVDELMTSLAGRWPPVSSRARVAPLERIRKTLRRHYNERRRRHGLDRQGFYDRDLRRLFADPPAQGMSAARFLRQIRRDARRRVAQWTRLYNYTIDQVLNDMITRAKELGLRLVADPDQAARDFTVLLAVHTMNYLHSGRHRVAL